ncbi:hypothetical protein DSO57_1029824 [Entomophthora muscae]|uniref:Uncharacterized protein n=1 Tax=Entomophthora muscae TaxID=34485 RepID=A0ACC2TCR3_9FUNG|nr:hypothetical protein DSO57_1029824 [Entomophthora muscae]
MGPTATARARVVPATCSPFLVAGSRFESRSGIQNCYFCNTLHELYATTQRQAPPEAVSQPNPQVAVFKTQVAALQKKILDLQAAITESTSFPGPTKDEGCCPGMPGQPSIYCARELIALANRLYHMKQHHNTLDKDFQEMTKLIDSVNEQFSSCLLVGISLTLRLAEHSTVVTNQGHQLDTAEQQTGCTAEAGICNSNSLVTLEESV